MTTYTVYADYALESQRDLYESTSRADAIRHALEYAGWADDYETLEVSWRAEDGEQVCVWSR